jgi:hypothetical protein
MVLRLSGASFESGFALRSRIGTIVPAARTAVTQLGRTRAGFVAFGSPSHGGSILVYGRSDKYYGGLAGAAGGAVVRGTVCR